MNKLFILSVILLLGIVTISGCIEDNSTESDKNQSIDTENYPSDTGESFDDLKNLVIAAKNDPDNYKLAEIRFSEKVKITSEMLEEAINNEKGVWFAGFKVYTDNDLTKHKGGEEIYYNSLKEMKISMVAKEMGTSIHIVVLGEYTESPKATIEVLSTKLDNDKVSQLSLISQINLKCGAENPDDTSITQIYKFNDMLPQAIISTVAGECPKINNMYSNCCAGATPKIKFGIDGIFPENMIIIKGNNGLISTIVPNDYL